MLKHAGHLIDISTVPAEEINQLVISQINQNGQAVIISRYEDTRWDLNPYIQTNNSPGNAIIFQIKLDDGSSLTDSQNSRLLESIKRFLYVRWKVKAPHSGKYISARTLLNNWSQLRTLIQWMSKASLQSFSELSAQKCLDYVTYCNTEKNLMSSTLVINYQIITTYYDLNDHLVDKIAQSVLSGQ